MDKLKVHYSKLKFFNCPIFVKKYMQKDRIIKNPDCIILDLSYSFELHLW